MIAHGLEVFAVVSLGLGVLSALWLAVEIIARPPQMRVMAMVWPLCALFAGTLVIWFKHAFAERHDDSDQPFAVSVAKGTLHCGAGCTLGDLIAENLAHYRPGILTAFGLGTLFHQPIFATWVLDFVLAFAIGIAFQYCAIVPMRDLSPDEGLLAAIKADTLSLGSWQVGMYGTMALVHFMLVPRLLDYEIDASMPLFWCAMQVAMLAGFATAYLPNWWLISRGIKEAM